MNSFRTIPATVLKNIASGSENIPTMYYHRFRPIQNLFWSRLATITQLIRIRNGVVLDFGGGGGVFLPTLSQIFKKVVCLDLCIEEAQKVVDMYALNNVEIIQGDALKIDLPENHFDVAIAADVLEHFRELKAPVHKLFQWLKPGGHFFISGPSENWLYRLGRRFFRIQKPADHYHSVNEIEEEVSMYFRIQKKVYLPWHSCMSFLELFAVFTILEVEKPV